MKRLSVVLLGLGLLAGPRVRTQAIPSGQTREDAISEAFSRTEFQGLLQRFVDAQYLKSFRRLGEEEDFDHAHLLFGARSPARPVAILYHTQELAREAALDPRARNWIQWVEGGAVEEAVRYERKDYPPTAAWDWFLHQELPTLRQRHTILDKMLDPARFGAEALESRQWVFSLVECGRPPPRDEAQTLRIALSSGPLVCLALVGPSSGRRLGPRARDADEVLQDHEELVGRLLARVDLFGLEFRVFFRAVLVPGEDGPEFRPQILKAPWVELRGVPHLGAEALENGLGSLPPPGAVGGRKRGVLLQLGKQVEAHRADVRG